MNNLKRFLALVLAMSMMLTLVPFGVFAADGDIGHMATKPADGTSSNEPFPQGAGESNSFRIPALVTLSDGTLVAAADARWNSTLDNGGIDTLVAVSEDQGKTWYNSYANYLGDNGNEYSKYSSCFIDPALAVTEDDTIYMLCDLYPYGVAITSTADYTSEETQTGFDSQNRLLLSNDSHATYGYYLSERYIYSTAGVKQEGYYVDEHFNVFKNDEYHSNLFFDDCDFKVQRTGYLYLTKGTYDADAKSISWSAPELLPLKSDYERACLVGPGRGLVDGDLIVFPVYSYRANASEYTSLIYSEDGGDTWQRSASLTTVDSSEAAAVMLPSGDLRVFFRNHQSRLCYADYSFTTGWSSWNKTDVAVNSNTQLSAFTYSKTYDDKQVVLLSCPAGPEGEDGTADNTGGSYSSGGKRLNGRIFAFTIHDTEELSGVLTEVGELAVNSGNAEFMYSCITELNDGSVAILYEDHQNGWGGGNSSYYYTMDYKTYTESDLETAFGVTFDEVTTSTNILSDSATNVQVDMGSTDVTGWTMTVTPDQTVSGLTGSYVAYDVTITKADGTNYTGSADVTLPLGELAGKNVYPFVITDGAVEKLTATKVGASDITFTAPHFSVMGVAVEEETTQGETVKVTLEAGQTETYTIDGVALEDGTYTDNVATVTWVGTEATTATSYATAQLQNANVTTYYDYTGTVIDVANCLYTFTETSDGVWSITGTDADGNTVYLYPGNGISGGTTSGYPHTTTPPTGLEVYVTSGGLTGSFYISSNLNVWNNGKTTYLNFTRNAYRWNRNESVDSTNCSLYLYRAATTGEESSTEIPGYVKVTSLDDVSSDCKYLVAAPGADGATYVAYPSTNEDSLYTQIAKVTGETVTTGTTTTASTTVTITGNAAGNTQVDVGTTTYDITVKAVSNLKDTITSSGDSGVAYVLDTDGVIDTDTTYLIVSTGTDGTGNALTNNGGTVTNTVVNISNGQISAENDANMAWTFSSSTGGHITNNGYYLEGYNENLTLTQSANYSYTVASAGDGAYMLYIYLSGWYDYIFWNGSAWATAYVYNNAANISPVYLYAKQSAESWTVDAAKQRDRYQDMTGLFKDDYTDETWSVYEEARVAARDLLNEVTNATYPSEAAAQAALDKLIAAMDALEEAKAKLVEAKIITVNYQMNGITVLTENYKITATDSTLTLPATVVANNVAYGISATQATGIVITDGVLTLPAVDTSVNIALDKIAALGGGFVGGANIGVGNDHQGTKQTATVLDQPVTEMTVTTGITYDLNLKDTLSSGQYVVWSTGDENVATVDENGLVTSTGVGTTNIIANVYNADGTLATVNSIPITVLQNNYEDGDPTRVVALYIENIDNTTIWCMINGDVDGVFEVIEGELIYGNFKTYDNGDSDTSDATTDPTTTTAFTFFGDPDEAHALVAMTASDSFGDYYVLHDDEGNLVDADNYYYDTKNNGSGQIRGAGYWQAVGLGSTNSESNPNYDIIKAMVEWAIKHGCDGGQGFTRRNEEIELCQNLTFVSDPMPKIAKEVDGVLPTSRKQADFRRYTDGMVAAVNELVYFKITITLDRPTVWVTEKNADNEIVNKTDANGYTYGAITYTNAYVEDIVLPGAYLYTKELDQQDGKYDGEIAEDYRTQLQNITDQLNATWDADTKQRVIELYLVYEIQESDIPKFYIDNVATLAYNYQSDYSTGAQKGAADAEARISVVGTAIDNVVIDFGQTVVYTGLENVHLKGVFVEGENDVAGVTASKGTAKYGDVTVTREQKKDADGNLLFDEKNYPLYDYVVTYTPTQILQDVDTVLLYGIGDENKEKIINGFLVYPATTVYYEEGFMLGGDAAWVNTEAKGATVEQTFELLGESQFDDNGLLTGKITNKKHAYGYDPIYDVNAGASMNSQIASTTVGNATSFTFTGTGFDLYANCTEDTGYVSVQVRDDIAGKVVKMYTVNTVVGEDIVAEGDSTDGQKGNMYSLPIVSNQDLDHSTYTVTLRKIKADGKPVQIDGVRIFNTVKDSSVFNIDLEDNPEFYQLRDYVLSALDITDTTSADYGTLAEMADQVYEQVSSDSEAPTSVILADRKYNSDVQNLLDNGPKNEIYLHAGETLVFNVKTSRALQVGLKAPAGETSYSISGATNTAITGSMKSSVDMFYELGNTIGTETTHTITITNTGSNILAVTDLKICDDPTAAFVALTEEDIETALIAMGYCDHSYEAVVTAPTCTEAGYTTYTCTVCGDTYVGDETEALGHSHDAVVTASTCTEAGYTTYTCTVCGDSYVGDETAALGHSHETVVTDPTCTEQGYTTYTCHCGDTYVGDYVDATGHTYANGSCTECGEADPNYSGSSSSVGQIISQIIGWLIGLLKP